MLNETPPFEDSQDASPFFFLMSVQHSIYLQRLLNETAPLIEY